METYHVLIIGGGMAGCILATRIAQNGVHPENGKQLRVAILERGPYFKGDPKSGYGVVLRRRMFTNITPEFREGGRYSMGLFPSRFELNVTGEERANERGGPTPIQDVASIVGGGSLHWDAKTQVPYDLDYEAWAYETGVDWTADKFRGAGEEIRTLFNIHARPDPLLRRGDFLFRDAARALGHEVIDSMVAKRNCIGCGFCNSADMCKYDAKMGPLITHLPLAEKLGVEIIPNAEVEKVVLEKHGARVVAKGALYRRNGTAQSVAAEKVIVSCGTFATPLLLFRSGYGRKDILGSNIIVENQNIGRNMDAKPGAEGMRGIFNEDVTDMDYHDGGFYFHQDVHPKGYVDRLEIGTGGPGGWAPPYSWATNPLAPQFGKEHKDFMRQVCDPAVKTAKKEILYRSISVSTVVVRAAEVRGYLDARGLFYYDRSRPSVVKRLLEAREIAQEIFRKMGAKEVLGASGPLRVTSATMQIASCRAGADRSTSVVNSDFESHDVENLFICDGSALPREASHGYGAVVATLATYAAERMVAKYFSARS